MFVSRSQAGQQLAKKLLRDCTGKELDRAIVLGIPRGGVVVAAQIAKALQNPLDIIVTRKIPSPQSSELALGAIGETEGSKYLNEHLVKELVVSGEYLAKEIKTQQQEIKRRESLYRQGRQAINLRGKTAIIVDDGAATGATLIAASREVWNQKPTCVIIALPVAPRDTVQILEKEADEVQVLETPEPFFAVGQFYEEFEQVSDEEVVEILSETNLAN